MIYAFYDRRIPKQNVERLGALGFLPVGVPPCTSLSSAVCAHTDLQMIALGDTLFIHGELAKKMPSLAKARGIVADEIAEREVAHEARLCALLLGNRIFANPQVLSKKLLSLAEEKGLHLVRAKQSYAACSTLVLNERRAVTADEGMCRAMLAEGIEVLKISAGNVLLPPYPYGFIGGATGVFKDCVYFIGSLDTHPDGARIRALIEECGMRCCSLSDGPLFDGGGIVFWESEGEIFAEEDAEDDGKNRDQEDTCNTEDAVGNIE